MKTVNKLKSWWFRFYLKRLVRNLNKSRGEVEALLNLERIVGFTSGYIDPEDEAFDPLLLKISSGIDIITRFGHIYDQLDELVNLMRIASREEKILISDYQILDNDITVSGDNYFTYQGRFAFRQALATLFNIYDGYIGELIHRMEKYENNETFYEVAIKTEMSNCRKILDRTVKLLDPLVLVLTTAANMQARSLTDLIKEAVNGH